MIIANRSLIYELRNDAQMYGYSGVVILGIAKELISGLVVL